MSTEMVPHEHAQGTGWVTADGSVTYENHTDLDASLIDPYMREIASQLTDWAKGRSARANASGLFQRDKYASPDNPYEQMRVAKAALADDDVVGTTADVLEGLMLQQVTWESSNVDLADLFNQVNAGINMDGYLRMAARELLTFSQVITASRWGWEEFTPRVARVRKKKAGAETDEPVVTKSAPVRRKSYRLYVPQRLETLDPLKVVPVGISLFGRERLAWNPTKEEANFWAGVQERIQYDPVMTELFEGTYVPTDDELVELTKLNVPDPKGLILMRSDRVWRHTLTKQSYDRFADIRLRGAFRFLDMKQQLLEADRVALVGAANYIMLVKKGDATTPGQPAEIQNLRENFRQIAKIPVIISDHRLNVEIITPKTDFVLKSERYNMLDTRIVSRMLNSLDIGAGGTGDSAGQVRTRMIGRALENRRRMLRRMVEAEIRDAVWNHPANKDVLAEFKEAEKPSLAFNPRNIQIDNDSQLIQMIQHARDTGDLSRYSQLEFMGFDQEVEAQRRTEEKERFDHIFETAIPFSSPNGKGNGASDGAKGGRPEGGGSPSANDVKPSTSANNTKKES